MAGMVVLVNKIAVCASVTSFHFLLLLHLHEGDSNDATCAVVRVLCIPSHAKHCCRPSIWSTTVSMILVILLTQGFSLASALGHSPEQILDVREQAGQVGHFVREHFRQCTVFNLLDYR